MLKRIKYLLKYTYVKKMCTRIVFLFFCHKTKTSQYFFFYKIHVRFYRTFLDVTRLQFDVKKKICIYIYIYIFTYSQNLFLSSILFGRFECSQMSLLNPFCTIKYFIPMHVVRYVLLYTARTHTSTSFCCSTLRLKAIIGK